MKVGLFFGSFDPPHIGHTVIAEYMLEAMGASEIWMVISPQNPFKEESGLSHENIRMDLVKRALNGHPQIKPCGHEFSLPRPSYTIDTLRSLSKDHPEKEFFLIMGSDNLLDIKGWKEYEAILKDFPLAVYPRPGSLVNKEFLSSLKSDIQLIDAPQMDLGSTLIRTRIKDGKPYRMMLRESVWRAIEREGHYR